MDAKELFSSSLEIDVAGGVSVWAYCGDLRRETKDCVNHGVGFPNWKCEPFIKEAAKKAIEEDHNQYGPPQGITQLRKALLKSYKRKFGSNKLDEKILDSLTIDNIQITNGCASALDASFFAFLNPGDEVIAIEPYFDVYKYQICHRKAVLKTVSLDLVKKYKNENKNSKRETNDKNEKNSPIGSSRQQEEKSDKNTNGNGNGNDDFEYEWSFDVSKLERAIDKNKTKMIVINTPHNPTGYVMSYETMLEISQMLSKYPNIIVLTDEVYEHILFDNNKHYHFACLPNMFDRTITLSSAAKTFSVTGWKIGWAIASNNLIKYIAYAARGACWSVNTPLQYAMYDIITFVENDNNEYKGCKSYYEWLSQMYNKKRDLMVESIIKLGMKPIIPQGTFYIVADAKALIDKYICNNNNNNNNKDESKNDDSSGIEIDFNDPRTFKDWKFAEWLVKHLKISTIPVSAFIDYQHLEARFNQKDKNICKNDENTIDLLDKGFDLIRFCFCVTDETIKKTGSLGENMADMAK